MKYVHLAFLSICIAIPCLAQPQGNITFAHPPKPSISVKAISRWQFPSGGIITNNGKIVAYHFYDAKQSVSKLIVQSVDNKWRREFERASSPVFTNDNRYLIFKQGEDSLSIFYLKTLRQFSIPKISKYKIYSNQNKVTLAYSVKNESDQVTLWDITDNRKMQYSGIKNYNFSPDGSSLLTITGPEWSSRFRFISVVSMKASDIKLPDGLNVSQLAIDPMGNLAFIIERKTNNGIARELWYYQKNLDSSFALVTTESPGIEKQFSLTQQLPEFSTGGKYIIFYLKCNNQKPVSDKDDVDIWSYDDPVLHDELQVEKKGDKSYCFSVTVNERRISRLEQVNDRIISKYPEWALVCNELGDKAYMEANWNSKAQMSYYRVRLFDGHRSLLRDKVQSYDGGVEGSPKGKYAIYYDFEDKNYYSIDVTSGNRRNITKGAATTWTDEENDFPESQLPAAKKWINGENGILISDTYDLWLVDPTGNRQPVNLTNGYGRKNKIKFELIDSDLDLQNCSVNSRIWLKAINTKNKQWGFYSKKLNVAGDPVMCSMGPYVFGWWSGYRNYNYPPIKAKLSNTYLIVRMSATEAPNYFITTDFKSFQQLTNIQPQSEYNWLTATLVHFKTTTGDLLSGILYKPENFDSTKRYPVIFDYYDKRSDELNLYMVPHTVQDRINIPLFVSNGYVVFAPDIKYKTGQPGKSALNCVLSAANYLAQFSWVDQKRMGLHGHSFGAYETNYIISQTNLFAAACSVSGFCDLVSWYGSAARAGFPMYWAERSQGRMVETPWENMQAYLNNSPILHADKVSTPLLMVNNKSDEVVLFSQGIEFFTVLRRLGKKVWMLQYRNSGHSLGRRDSEDFTVRLMQFFDHYLKGEKPAEWINKSTLE